ncbi:MAG: bifunctional folylpolyglutamate synthase/dihydrofolate synthase [Clostridia bacterium]|nr:MAG: bifunctional folylpolyglutamate synthase/dihydrofolate synthase [Clostridia bacterium]
MLFRTLFLLFLHMKKPYARTLREIFLHVDYSRNRQHPYNAETYNLDRMRELVRRMGLPQTTFASVHIAGSKGKGSTSAMTEAILRTAGYRTGLYTSPHLHTFRERMRIDGALIPRQRLVALWKKVKPVVESMTGATTFEIITLLAFMHFSEPPVDWAVIEVGLGGSLDATNVILPAACAITSLSLEHTDLLGDTIAAIAAEKAGIIKPDVPVITGPQTPVALSVIQRVAKEVGAPLVRLGVEWRWRLREQRPDGLLLDIFGPDSTITDVSVPLTGAHQAINATLAVALASSIADPAYPLSPATIRRGLAHTYWPGRLEQFGQQPRIVLDSAHNRESATRLKDALKIFPHQRLFLLFGASSDKDIDGMLDILGFGAAEIILTRSFHPRAADVPTMARIARKRFPRKMIHLTEDVAPALSLALSRAHPDDLILVAGSIFVVAAAREAWRDFHPSAFSPDDWVYTPEPIDGQFTPMLPRK